MKFSFKFGKRFGFGRLTAEQQSVVERLERGEISEEEAERLLGGADVRTYSIRLGDVEDAPESEAEQAPARESAEDAKARELIERISRDVDAETRG